MTAAAAPYAAFLEAASARALGASGQAKAAASLGDGQSSHHYPQAIATNRNAFVQLVRSNFLELNAPAVAAAD